MTKLREVDATRPRGRLYRAYARLTGTRPMGWLSRVVLWRIDPLLMRWTSGRVSLAFPIPTGLLETRGAKTGQPRRNVLIYFHDGERVTLVASKLGLDRHPAWYHNLRAHPDVVFAGRPFRAQTVGDAGERSRLWAMADNVFPAYATYRERAGRAGRTIPLVQLVPR